MRRTIAAAATALFAGAAMSVCGAGQEVSAYQTRLTKDGSGIAYVRQPANFTGIHGPLSALPTYNPNNMDWAQIDLRSRDIKKLDVASRLADLRHAVFDSQTKWPPKLPDGFDPARVMDANKDPGLGLRALHRQGITGKGVSIAIIDQGLLVGHVEYRDRLRLYEEIHAADETSMHGPAVSSIAVGKTAGVAPEADLYYIAMFQAKDGTVVGPGREPELDHSVVAKCIDRLLQINRNLPRERKIRVISMSLGWMPDTPGVKELGAAIERARQEGVFVLSVNVQQTHGLPLAGLARDALADPDKLSSYRGMPMVGGYLDQPGAKPLLWVPMDARTTASPTGTSDYVFYAHGGASWTVPYAAGLYALACQVRPDVTPETFWRKAIETGDTISVMTPRRPDTNGAVGREVDAQIGKLVTQLKQAKDKDPEVAMAEVCAARTGEKRERMSEADFRAWARGLMLDLRLGDGKTHRMGNVVNPARLIAGLRKQ